MTNNARRRPKRPTLPTFIRTDEFADALAVDPSTVRRWIDAGVVKAAKLHGAWRIPTSEVDRLMSELAEQGRVVRVPLVSA